MDDEIALLDKDIYVWLCVYLHGIVHGIGE